MITMFTLPPSTGLGDVYTNLGSLENKGVELEINAEVLRFGKDGSWTIGFNASRVKNKILELPENGVENNRIGGEYVWDASKINIPGKVACRKEELWGICSDINN